MPPCMSFQLDPVTTYPIPTPALHPPMVQPMAMPVAVSARTKGRISGRVISRFTITGTLRAFAVESGAGVRAVQYRNPRPRLRTPLRQT